MGSRLSYNAPSAVPASSKSPIAVSQNVLFKPVANITDYKYDMLHALCNLMANSPSKLNGIISEGSNIDLLDVRRYKWMGLNILHLIDIFIGFQSLTWSTSQKKIKLYSEYLQLRRTVINKIPDLLNDKTGQLVFFTDNDTFIRNGPLTCKYKIPVSFPIVHGYCKYDTNPYMCTKDVKSHNTLFATTPIRAMLTLNQDLTRMEFILKLQSVFPEYIIFKNVDQAQQIIHKFIDNKKDQNNIADEHKNADIENQVEGQPINKGHDVPQPSPEDDSVSDIENQMSLEGQINNKSLHDDDDDVPQPSSEYHSVPDIENQNEPGRTVIPGGI